MKTNRRAKLVSSWVTGWYVTEVLEAPDELGKAERAFLYWYFSDKIFRFLLFAARIEILIMLDTLIPLL